MLSEIFVRKIPSEVMEHGTQTLNIKKEYTTITNNFLFCVSECI